MSVYAMMALSGVRVSCETVARKRLFSWLASSAAASAARRAASVAYPVTLTGVLADLGRCREMRFSAPVLGSPVEVQEPQVGALRLILGPPLDEPRTLAPEGDDPVRVQQEDGVVAYVLSECGKGSRGDARLRQTMIRVARQGGPLGALATAGFPAKPRLLAFRALTPMFAAPLTRPSPG
jgi:hypothetical protein